MQLTRYELRTLVAGRWENVSGDTEDGIREPLTFATRKAAQDELDSIPKRIRGDYEIFEVNAS